MPVDIRPRYRPVAARHEPVAPRQSARPEPVPARPDETVDVVVVGSGCGGLATALFCAWRGLTVTLLEKAPQIGGTTRKSAFWTWVPNNPHLAAMNLVDDRDDFMRYCLRTARPEKYDPGAPFLGASEGDYRLVEAIYEGTWPAVQELHDRGGLRFRPAPQFLDYLAHLEEDRVPYGRVMVPEDSNEEMTNGGVVAVDSLSTACLAAGVEIRVGYRVQRLLVGDTGEVAGVMAGTVDAGDLRITARRGVVFATGGFTHDQELVENFLAFPSLGGCAARTNEGDFARIAPTVGAQLRNMQHAWRSAVPLERVAAGDPHMNATTSWPGDSMIGVNLDGHRCLNEKLPYNELAAEMGVWDSREARYPNLFMIQLWGMRQRRWRM
ncbi:MAG: FAD-dependent oxidoreductase, partial [Phycisphaerales bacterium]